LIKYYTVLMQRLVFSSLLLPLLPHPHFHCDSTRVAAREITFEHSHDFSELFLVTAGRGLHRVNGGRQELQAGDLLWVEADDAHFYEGPETGELQFLNLALEPGWWARFRGLFAPPSEPGRWRSGGLPRPRHLQRDSFARVEQALQALVRVGPLDDWQLISALQASLPLLVQGDEEKADKAPAWLKMLVGLMREPKLVANPLSWWQAKAGCSKEHLARSCRKHYGKTLTDMLNAARIAQVQARLLGGKETVSTLALELGFEHIGHFHALFKAHTGCTPLEWQRRQTQATVPRR
jgi:AraC family cel operon transcriptional repressor